MTGRAVFLVALVTLCLFTSGCWDARELNATGLVDAVAIDKAADPKKVQLTAAIVNRAAFERDAAYPNTAEPVVNFSTTGSTVFEAVRAFTLVAGEKLFWGHADTIVIGEELAKEGVLPWIDFFVRDTEPRLRDRVFVVKDGRGEDVFSVQPRLKRTPSQRLTGLVDAQEYSTRGVEIDLREFLLMLSNPYAGAIASRIEIVEKRPDSLSQPAAVPEGPTEPRQEQGLRLTGAALFKEGRLVGWFGQREARGWSWIQGKAERGALVVPCPGDPEMSAAVESFESSVKRMVSFNDGMPRVHLQIRVETRHSDQMCPEDLSPPQALEKLAKRAATAVKEDVELALQTAKELNTDVFGFSDLIRRADSQRWDSIKDRWDKVFPILPVSLEVLVKVRETGRVTKSIWGLRDDHR